MFKTILVAYDGSDHAQRAVSIAGDLAASDGAAVHLVTVVDHDRAPESVTAFAEAEHVGVTAGTSTPHDVIDRVYLHVCRMAGYEPPTDERTSVPDRLVQVSIEKERATHRLQKQMTANRARRAAGTENGGTP